MITFNRVYASSLHTKVSHRDPPPLFTLLQLHVLFYVFSCVETSLWCFHGSEQLSDTHHNLCIYSCEVIAKNAACRIKLVVRLCTRPRTTCQLCTQQDIALHEKWDFRQYAAL